MNAIEASPDGTWGEIDHTRTDGVAADRQSITTDLNCDVASVSKTELPAIDKNGGSVRNQAAE